MTEGMADARPYGVLAMAEYARSSAVTDEVLTALGGFAEVDPGLLVADFADPAHAGALARAEFLVSGWGCPPLTAEALDRMPKLRVNVHAAGSVKHHTTEEVWRRGIAVSSAADANAVPVAEYTRAVIILALKRAFALSAGLSTEGWPSPDNRVPAGVVSRTVGLVGASRIGRLVIERLRDLGVRLVLSDPYLTAAEAAELGCELVDLDELVSTSDVVSLHAPELPETRHLMDGRRLAMMRDHAVLVNTARGSLVDTEALAKECASGRLDAVLDVTDPEPIPREHVLLTLPNVFVTPHLAGAQGTEIALLGSYAVADLRRFLAGEAMLGAVDIADLPRLA
ncbi:2-hydroxyacid dehydrogenase [Actinorhabdospora filicis]|uniref:2-hydroxyacid dehydrogenase n=1 Tax=Actinorhabdospora filicis TaxID=1785913 RepID=A0A9W6WAL8_9ACTN|nr:hydroxyacid dehydrogenase [Actinorhabdospora filicis]GLZ77780.1 2-hydroxyacid dehydrogenase [Actinorhabdospora filicis]